MPGKAEVTVALPAAAAPQKSYPFVLKKIMDIPPPNILEEGDDGKLPVSILRDLQGFYFKVTELVHTHTHTLPVLLRDHYVCVVSITVLVMEWPVCHVLLPACFIRGWGWGGGEA